MLDLSEALSVRGNILLLINFTACENGDANDMCNAWFRVDVVKCGKIPDPSLCYLTPEVRTHHFPKAC